MKNIININTSGEQLISSVDDGTNTLFINGNAIASSNWVGTGNYTANIEGHNITIAKAADLNGNIIIQKVSDYNYKLLKAIQGYYLYQDENGDVDITGDIILPNNNSYIRGMYPDDVLRNVFQLPNAGGNLVIGYGAYTDSVYSTNIYGNTIKLISKAGISIDGANMSVQEITNITDIITVDSSVATINSADFVQWGNIAQICVVWTNNRAISVPASGNITNMTIGTLVSGKRPEILTGAWSQGDNAGASWYNINPNGNITLGAVEGTGSERTIAAGTAFSCYATFILA